MSNFSLAQTLPAMLAVFVRAAAFSGSRSRRFESLFSFW
jgi:hypothetical protein